MTSPSFLPELQEFLRRRLAEPTEGSYSVQVMGDRGLAQRKLMEEAFEVCLEIQADQPDRAALAAEAADLVFHLMALLTGADLDWSDVEAVLRDRHRPDGQQSGRTVRIGDTEGSASVTATAVVDEPTDRTGGTKP